MIWRPTERLAWLALALSLGAWAPGPAKAAAADVQLPSLDGPGGTAVVLRGHWFAAQQPGPAPALAPMHGCGGAYDTGALAAAALGVAPARACMWVPSRLQELQPPND